MTTQKKFIISGGGTGGHIFPAIAIADALKSRYPDSQILFIGAKGRMEMEKVPQAGYAIKALPIMGLDRKRLWRNFLLIFKLIRSIRLAKKYIKEFQPTAVIGVGGYASLPTLLTAQEMGIPTFIQEQNSFAGKANKTLASRAKAICVAYEGMDRFFPAEKLFLTGNPIRKEIEREALPSKVEASERLAIETQDRPVIVVVGGSLGALTINESVQAHLEEIANAGIALLWQTGKKYIDTAEKRIAMLPIEQQCYIKATPFIQKMADAYAIADLMISRAGASTVSELQLLGQPSILVPSPNVAEDHQTHNAMALSSRHAAILVSDLDAPKELVKTAITLVEDRDQLARISQNAKAMALPSAADKIVDIIDTTLTDNDK